MHSLSYETQFFRISDIFYKINDTELNRRINTHQTNLFPLKLTSHDANSDAATNNYKLAFHKYVEQ